MTLHIAAERWHAHLRTVAAATPGLVPVAKGNGYGFGLDRLAGESEGLGVSTVAVGRAEEVAAVRKRFSGRIVVLTPWRPGDTPASELLDDDRVVTTVSRLDDLRALAARGRPGRVLLEVLTSMRRYGLRPEELPTAVAATGPLQVEGWTIHLPLLDRGRVLEAETLARAALAAARAPLWLSHLPVDESQALAHRLAGPGGEPAELRLRVGTRLWLGDAGALTTSATVQDVHPVRRGERTGYRQRAATADGWLVVLAGGTSHGIGLEAPTAAGTARQRAVALATGGLEAMGRALSPYTIAGRKRWFLEPPHMQASLVLLPRKVTPPAVGDQVPVELRLTTAAVDHVVLD